MFTLCFSFFLGHGSIFVEDLPAFFDTMERLKQLVAEENITQMFPSHGVEVKDPMAALQENVDHRQKDIRKVTFE